MEARFEVSVTDQEDLATAARGAGGKRFQIPDEFALSLVTPAFLGQLDVNPMGTVPGSQNDSQRREFWGQTIGSEGSELVRIRIDGESHITGGHNGGGGGRQPRNDGRMFEHLVTLKWQGYADLNDNRVTQLVMIANGNERLRAGNPRADFLGAPAASHLMAGHPIDLDCAVRYGLSAEPCSSEEIVEGAGTSPRAGLGPGQTLPVKMQRLQAGIKRLQQAGDDPSNIMRVMKDFGPLMRQRKHDEAEAMLDRALKLLGDNE